MTREKRKDKEWARIAIPVEMYKFIEEIIQNDFIKKRFGYRSVSEFVRDAITNHLENLEKLMREK